MQAIRARDTRPEVALRRALWRIGYRYRLDVRPLQGFNRRADLVFRSQRVAVFVDGCFWHGCPQHGRRTHEVNSWYWPVKIQGNRLRDADTDEQLRRAGWTVVRIWEHESVEDGTIRAIAALQATHHRGRQGVLDEALDVSLAARAH